MEINCISFVSYLDCIFSVRNPSHLLPLKMAELAKLLLIKHRYEKEKNKLPHGQPSWVECLSSLSAIDRAPKTRENT